MDIIVSQSVSKSMTGQEDYKSVNCYICKEVLSINDNTTVKYGCSHVFHSECLFQSIKNKEYNKCDLCQEEKVYSDNDSNNKQDDSDIEQDDLDVLNEIYHSIVTNVRTWFNSISIRKSRKWTQL